jgi:outer membrane protein assembly factor BamB
VVAQYRLEPSHQGISPPGTSVGPDLEMAWKSEPLAIGRYRASKSSPAVDAALIYIGVDDGQLYALDRSNGAVVWKFKRVPIFWADKNIEQNQRLSVGMG